MFPLVLVCPLFLLALGVALYFLLRARRRLARLEADLASLARDFEHADDELTTLLAELGGSRILVEIIDPGTLARRKSRLAGPLAGLAPRFIRRRVYGTVAREIKAQLAENGVESRVDIFHPGGAPGRA